MRCLSPIWMYDSGRLTKTGKKLLATSPNPRLPFVQSGIPVPCGHCSACLRNRMNEWISRLRCEKLVHDCGSFVTLTYKDNPGDLFKRDVQLFLKRLRNASRDFGVPDFKLRYFVAGEFGSKKGRPHWHGLLFGLDALSSPWKPSLVAYKDGHPIYTSELLTSIWSKGFTTVDRIDDRRIKYVAKYILKDGSSKLQSAGLGRSLFVDVKRVGRQCDYRLRPLFESSVANGFVTLPDRVGFTTVGIPKAFDRYLERCDGDLFDYVRNRRKDFVSSQPFDSRSVEELERTIQVLSSSPFTPNERPLHYE